MFSTQVAVLIVSFAAYKCYAQDYEGIEKLIYNSIQESDEYIFPREASEFIPNSDDIEDLEDVDFIIVGAGASGAVLANRLSEVSQWNILVLEAGTFGNEFSIIPAMQPYLMNSKYNWGFQTTPQKNICASNPGQICSIPRGKAVGGTTAIYGNRYVRGTKNDFEYWTASGNPGWDFKYCLPYYKKIENTKMDDIDIEYHGFEGPLQSEHHQPLIEFDIKIIGANVQLGNEYIDYNGRQRTGVSRSQQNTKNGQRQSTGRVFIDPILGRNNFKVVDKSYVIKVLIDESTKIASGVIFSRNNRLYRVKASKEVILSAGAISTPQLLMLSGIGPADHLNQLRIKVIEDLGVGESMIDDVSLFGIYINTNMTVERKTTRQNLEEFFKGYGQFTVSSGTTALGYVESSLAEWGHPDIEIYFRPPYPVINYTREMKGFTEEAYNALYNNIDRLSAIEADVVVVHPRSRGYIKLVSSNPYVYPEIEPNFFSDPEGQDMKILLEGINYVLSLIQTPALRKINASLAEYSVPACLELEYLSEEYWKCIIQYYGSIGHRPVSTCRMGPDPTKGDVVDSKLKVHGIKNLRVVDASVFPRLSGHPAASCMMIAEKISDVIKLEYDVRPEGLDRIFSNKGILNEYLDLILNC